MDTKWLEDFVCLAETRSFSRAAQQRHVTQSAFSRRIQALESWLGVELVDRTCYPPSLTSAGERFEVQARDILGHLDGARSVLRSHAHDQATQMTLVAPHTLALNFLPDWLAGLYSAFPNISCRVSALNVHDAAQRLIENGCDFLFVYQHEALPLEIDLGEFESMPLAEERLLPFVADPAQGRAWWDAARARRQPLPFLAYASGAYLGRMTEHLLQQARIDLPMFRVYETDMSESLKTMALAGHGLAFLPASAVVKEVAEGRLHPLADSVPQAQAWQAGMTVRVYRSRIASQPQVRRPWLDALWQYMCRATEGLG